jgi:hypothetical protein
MALSASTVWECQVGGSDTAAGGGFNATRAGAGTDYSLQTTAQYSPTDLAAGSGSTTLTSAAAGFTSAMVGNLIRITAGTNVAAGHYEITAYTNSTTVTLDRTPTSGGALSGGTGYVGGALASPGYAGSVMQTGNDVWIKAGTYALTSTTRNVSGGRVTTNGGSNQDVARWIGYTITRGDSSTRPLLQASGAFASQTLVTLTSDTQWENIDIDGASKTSVLGLSGSGAWVLKTKIVNCTNGGATVSEATLCEVASCSGGNGGISMTGSGWLWGCTAHDTTGPGIHFNTAHGSADACLSYNNTGASGYGFRTAAVAVKLDRCIAYGNAQHGFYNSAAAAAERTNPLINCLAVNNGGYGFSAASTGTGLRLWNCAAYNNTSGTYPASTFLEVLAFVTLTADPFVAAGSQNFALNTTSGGGAALRAAGLPATWPGASASMIGYPDIGAAQHADPTGTVLGNWIGLV